MAGGDPWPPADTTPDAAQTAQAVEADDVSSPVTVDPVVAAAPDIAPAAPAPIAAVTTDVTLRQGLPREAGGPPWPPAGNAAVGIPAAVAAADAHAEPAPATTSELPAAPPNPTAAAPSAESSAEAVATEEITPLRQGLPRTEGGTAWPPTGAVAVVTTTPKPAEHAPAVHADVVAPAAQAAVALGARDVSTPLPFRPMAWQGHAPRFAPRTTAPASARPRPTWVQALGGLMGAAALGLVAGIAIVLTRVLLTLPAVHDFVNAYPGQYDLPESAPIGIPGWVGWQHFFNMFLMLLIIRSGLRVRTEKRPTVFWTSRRKRSKTSLTIWFHQALDVLWLVNGAIFVVLLFATGHWMRIVPTSWEVFPNALSSALQYVAFDWPTENGWVNYNSLQQLAYFTTVFIAAPLAAITGFRMSGLWPRKAEALSKAYPLDWARALHFPIMLYFVAFIVVHVLLVMLTGFLRNLNHMFAAQSAAGWTGFWVFMAALAVMAIGWIAARPVVIAPIAKLFGNVSGR